MREAAYEWLERSNEYFYSSEAVSADKSRYAIATDDDGAAFMLYCYEWPTGSRPPEGLTWFLNSLLGRGAENVRDYLTWSLWRSGKEFGAIRHDAMRSHGQLLIQPYGTIDQLLDEFYPSWYEVYKYAEDVNPATVDEYMSTVARWGDDIEQVGSYEI